MGRQVKITKYQAWRFSTTPTRRTFGPASKREERIIDQFEARYPLADARDSFEEAVADLIRAHEGFRNDSSGYDRMNRFDVIVPNPELQFASGDLKREW